MILPNLVCNCLYKLAAEIRLSLPCNVGVWNIQFRNQPLNIIIKPDIRGCLFVHISAINLGRECSSPDGYREHLETWISSLINMKMTIAQKKTPKRNRSSRIGKSFIHLTVHAGSKIMLNTSVHRSFFLQSLYLHVPSLHAVRDLSVLVGFIPPDPCWIENCRIRSEILAYPRPHRLETFSCGLSIVLSDDESLSEFAHQFGQTGTRNEHY